MKNYKKENILDEIGRIPLLTDMEVVELSKKIQDGIKAEEQLNSIKDENTLSLEEYNNLVERRDIGLKAKDKLVTGNLRLVVSMANKMSSSLDKMDLIQEGSIGLIRAAEKFDYTSGNKFSTYATYWIDQAMKRADINQGNNIRIPTHIIDEIRKINKAKYDLALSLKREATLEELSEAVGLPVDRIKDDLSYKSETVSLDMKLDEEEDSSLGDFIPDKNSDPSEKIVRDRQKAELDRLLKSILNEREYSVIEKRFGLNNSEKYTLDEISCMGPEKVTRERIRQIESQAMKKLRSSNEFRRLAEVFVF